jgi:hypothetical protein
VHGDARSAKVQQQDDNQRHVGGISRRSENSRRVFVFNPIQMSAIKLDHFCFDFLLIVFGAFTIHSRSFQHSKTNLPHFVSNQFATRVKPKLVIKPQF